MLPASFLPFPSILRRVNASYLSGQQYSNIHIFASRWRSSAGVIPSDDSLLKSLFEKHGRRESSNAYNILNNPPPIKERNLLKALNSAHPAYYQHESSSTCSQAQALTPRSSCRICSMLSRMKGVWLLAHLRGLGNYGFDLWQDCPELIRGRIKEL
jgi:hypothetical protein